jgi:hypothetical protein
MTRGEKEVVVRMYSLRPLNIVAGKFLPQPMQLGKYFNTPTF